MKTLGFLLIALLALATVGLSGPARKHYSLYRSVQREHRFPYAVEVKPAEYFSPFLARNGWHDAPTSSRQPTRTSDKILEELKWEKSVRSLVSFYTTDTGDIGLLRWMVFPRSSVLPSLQEMAFTKKTGGVICVDPQSTVALESLNASMVTLTIQKSDGLEEWLLVDDALYAKIAAKKATEK